jgi:hypothetical protein
VGGVNGALGSAVALPGASSSRPSPACLCRASGGPGVALALVQPAAALLSSWRRSRSAGTPFIPSGVAWSRHASPTDAPGRANGSVPFSRNVGEPVKPRCSASSWLAMVVWVRVVVDRRPWRLPAAVTALADRRRPQPLLGAQSPDPSLADVVTGSLELIGQEPVAELGVVGVGVDQGVGQVSVFEVTLADRVGQPGVERLPGVAQHPAGQPHRDPLGGQVTDQRVAHFGSEPTAK